MNAIIIYSSKYGCTADCAKVLKSRLSGTVELVNIDQTNPKAILLENFDVIIFGSSIYIGAISKKMRAFCNEYIEVLNRKRVGIFLCCAFPEEMNQYLSKNFPELLLKSAVTIKNFGGESRTDKLKGMDKLIMKAATKGDYSKLKISDKNIESFINEISK
ncbi:MAG: flavodoxin domain-containing protein [Lachnospiraceae bacterium]|nr:flavodoxin domain-containing protein [Lachnospiraceae bacterium]